MTHWKKALALATALMFVVGCKEQLQDVTDVIQDEDSYSVDMALESMNKASDDFDQEDIDHQNTPADFPTDQLVEDDFDTEVDQDTPDATDINSLLCRRPAKRRTCRSHGDESTKMAIYRRCLMPKKKLWAQGIVRLDYNNNSCDLSEGGQLVQRTYQLTLKRIHGGVAHISSREKENYLGDRFGGGEVLERSDDGWIISILGRHIDARNRQDHKRASLSIETSEPLIIKGSLNKRARTVVSGKTLVHHNLAKFTAAYTPENLVWAADCECPVSGSMKVEFRGSKTGSGLVVFNGCGQADLEKDRNPRKRLQLNQCFRIESDSESDQETDQENNIE